MYLPSACVSPYDDPPPWTVKEGPLSTPLLPCPPGEGPAGDADADVADGLQDEAGPRDLRQARAAAAGLVREGAEQDQKPAAHQAAGTGQGSEGRGRGR